MEEGKAIIKEKSRGFGFFQVGEQKLRKKKKGEDKESFDLELLLPRRKRVT